MLSHNEKSFARMDSAAILLLNGYTTKPARDEDSLRTFASMSTSRPATEIIRRADLKLDQKTAPAASIMHRAAMDALQGYALNAPEKVMQQLIADAHKMRHDATDSTNRRAMRLITGAAYQVIARDWPAVSDLPEDILKSVLALETAPRALPAIFATSATEEYRKMNAFMLVSGTTSLDNAFSNGNLAKAETLIAPSVMCQLRQTVLVISAQLQPQQDLHIEAYDALTKAYACTLTAGHFAGLTDEQQIAQSSAMRYAMDRAKESAVKMPDFDHKTRLHYATAFAERALVDTVGDAGQKQVMQMAMLVMGLDANLGGSGPGGRNDPPAGSTPQSRKLH